jgi:hypothetical protein
MGGAFFLHDSQLSIQNSNITSNNGDHGSAVAIINDRPENGALSVLNWKGTVVKDNIGGAALYLHEVTNPLFSIQGAFFENTHKDNNHTE